MADLYAFHLVLTWDVPNTSMTQLIYTPIAGTAPYRLSKLRLSEVSPPDYSAALWPCRFWSKPHVHKEGLTIIISILIA